MPVIPVALHIVPLESKLVIAGRRQERTPLASLVQPLHAHQAIPGPRTAIRDRSGSRHMLLPETPGPESLLNFLAQYDLTLTFQQNEEDLKRLLLQPNSDAVFA